VKKKKVLKLIRISADNLMMSNFGNAINTPSRKSLAVVPRLKFPRLEERHDRIIRRDIRWWKATEFQRKFPIEFLRKHESTCVSACDRFLHLNYVRDSVWLITRGVKSAGLLLMSGSTLYPVLDASIIDNNPQTFLLPQTLQRHFFAHQPRCVQGVRRDVRLLEEALSYLGYESKYANEYHLMVHDDYSRIKPGNETEILPGLNIRPPQKKHFTDLLEIQRAYELEEVILPGQTYRPESSVSTLTHILQDELILIAEYNSEVIGKINTNAVGFSHRQLGGVYVKPAYRRRGVCTAMLNAMIQLLETKGQIPSLYVRTLNTNAINAYLNTGFRTLSDYRISYLTNR
jgi:GNAT superfamily N-acetyltransferase